jgi:mannosyltransferase
MAAAERLSLAKAYRTPFAALAVGATLALALPLAYALNIWQDETYTLHTTSGSLAYAFRESLAFEQNAPLYFVLLTLWRHLDASIFFLRLFSAACAAATVLLVPSLARRYLPSVDPMLPTLLTAWNPFLIWAAVEMRVYALIILISSLLLLAFHEAFLRPRVRAPAAAVYALCVAVALYTQYYLAFLVAAQGIVLLRYAPRHVWRFALAAGAGAAVFTPMILVVLAQVHNFRGAFTPPSSILDATTTLASIVARYLLPLLVPHAKLVYAALAIGFAALCILRRRSFTKGGASHLLLIATIALLLFATAVYAAGVHVLNRHAASLYVPATLGVFSALTFLRPGLRERATTAWFCVAMLASTIALAQTYAPLAKPGDWLRATAYLRAHERPGEPIVVFEAENALPLAYYYHGPNTITAIPHAVDFRHYDVTRFVVHDEAELRVSLPRARELWLVTAGECASANIAFGCPVVERTVAADYRVEDDAAFFGSRVRLLRAKDPPR